ncbi:MAG: hypothetical protein LBD13_01285, partial [Spirochaetaceae bacterium]|nr:hypothetical protein [Spirochaetaceae bacterium]
FESEKTVFESEKTVFESEKTVFESEKTVFESEKTVFESEMIVFESEMIVPESNPDFSVCGLMVYSSIAYGLLRDGAVCSGLPVEPAPNTPHAAFLMSAKGAEKAKRAEREYI